MQLGKNELMNEKILDNEAVIVIKGLKKSFDTLKVLDGIDFSLFKGENIAILGRSGSGKSVLTRNPWNVADHLVAIKRN